MNKKTVTNTSAEFFTSRNINNSLSNTSQLKLSNCYLPSESKPRFNHSRVKTDDFNPLKAESTLSTCIDTKSKLNPHKELKPQKKFSSSETDLIRTRSNKLLSSLFPLKANSNPKTHSHKVTLHRRMCTLQSLQKLRS